MRKYVTPPYISEGDGAVIISPSGNTDVEYIEGAKGILENWGLRVELSPFCCEKYGRFGGTVGQRLSDLQSAMDNRNIRLILCARGGYGAVQLLDKLDFTEIKKYPKWLAGYSDITALHSAFLKNGIVSVHAPMTRHLTENNGEDTASKYLQKLLWGNGVQYILPSHPLNREGTVSSRLFGGNLAVLSALVGTPYLTIPENGILFIEDIAEAPYKIDRMMWQLKLSGILAGIKGLIVGQFTDCEEDPLMEATVFGSIKNIVSEYNYPVAFDFPVGHVKENYPLLHGGSIKLCVEKNNITIENTD